MAGAYVKYESIPVNKTKYPRGKMVRKGREPAFGGSTVDWFLDFRAFYYGKTITLREVAFRGQPIKVNMQIMVINTYVN